MGDSAKPVETSLRPFRVFISSPGDVDDERSRAQLALSRLQSEQRYRQRIAFQAVAWDGPGVSVPMRYTETPQHSVSRSIGDPADCDVAVILLWSRLGTPLPGKHVKEDGTPYRSGTDWELENALTGFQQIGKPQILVYRRPEQPKLDRKDPNVQELWDQQEAVDDFFDGLREPGTRAILRGVNDYAEPSDFGDKLERHLRELVEEKLGEWLDRGRDDEPTPTPRESAANAPYDKPPFPGLRAFQEEDAAVYFGRGAEIDALLELLRSPGPSLVLVVGASGSGKSSLVRAGLTPRLKNGAIAGSAEWLYTPPLTPSDAEQRPFHALAQQFGAILGTSDEDALASGLRANPASIAQLASDALSHKNAPALMLVVDQLEELFAEQALADQQAPFLALLAAGAGHGGLRIVATVRADFVHHCLDDPRLGPIVQSRSFMLRAPGEAALREMIQGPARVAGVTLDAAVVTGLIRDVCGRDGLPEPGALPLLAYALELLYQRRDRVSRHIGLHHYQGLGEGGARAAIGTRAESIFTGLPPEVRSAYGTVFRDLVHVSGEGTPTRRKAALADLGREPASKALVDALVAPDARLLVTDSTESSETRATVEVAHEALFSQWQRLRDWIAEYGGDLRLVRQLEAAARAWAAKPNDPLHRPWPHEAQVIAYDALTRLGRQWKSEAEPLQSFLRSEASRLLEKISLIETPHWRRAEIGDRLARIGDPRRGVGLSENGLPDIVWCRIPSGTVTLEDDDGTLEDNAETFEVEFFEIARFPVTYRQYRAFVEAADGYRDGRWWRGLRHEAEPGVPHRTTNNCPADHVSWHDAVAFCRWLSARFWEQGQLASKNIIRLPAEWEWQQAATRGSAGREYPWGEWDERFANSSESQLARTTAVGKYPHAAWAGDAPLDMTGNVFEWCRNKYEKPKVTIADESKDARVLRGGSWYDRRREARCSYRDSDHPGVRCGSVGFRVVCSFTID